MVRVARLEGVHCTSDQPITYWSIRWKLVHLSGLVELLEPALSDYVGLLELADSYCEKELKRLCEKLIWQGVTVDNVATLMTLASKYSTSVRTTSY